MALWLVRAGSRGEMETVALEKGAAVIGWSELSDLSDVNKLEDVRALVAQTYPHSKPKAIENWARQIWAFVGRMQQKDLVALPLKSRPTIGIGEVAGSYAFRPEFPPGARHTRPVKWLKEIPRDHLRQDLLFSFGAYMTVCRIERNDAEARIRAVLAGKPDVGTAGLEHSGDEPEESEAPRDLEREARDQIRAYIGGHFKGHDLSRLIKQLLEAKGYKTTQSPEGPDGGVDILAGSGQMGFDAPRLVVQVKSGADPVDVKVFRELQGVMQGFGADRGLLVAWSGFKGGVEKEARRHFFQIRLWNADDVVDEVQANYEQLEEALQTELPLKKIWALVPENEE